MPLILIGEASEGNKKNEGAQKNNRYRKEKTSRRKNKIL